MMSAVSGFACAAVEPILDARDVLPDTDYRRLLGHLADVLAELFAATLDDPTEST